MALEFNVLDEDADRQPSPPLTERLNTTLEHITKIEVRFGEGRQLTYTDKPGIDTIAKRLKLIHTAKSPDQRKGTGYLFDIEITEGDRTIRYTDTLKLNDISYFNTLQLGDVSYKQTSQTEELRNFIIQLGKNKYPNLLTDWKPQLTPGDQ